MHPGEKDFGARCTCSDALGPCSRYNRWVHDRNGSDNIFEEIDDLPERSLIWIDPEKAGK